MSHLVPDPKRIVLLGLALIALGACAEPPSEPETANAERSAPAPAAQVVRLEPGQPLPGGEFANLSPEGPARIDLTAEIGRRPVVLYYWIAGNKRAEGVFRDLEALMVELGDGAPAFYGVSVPRDNLANAQQIRARIERLGLRTPVIEDEGFVLGKRLGVEYVPHISIVDRQGTLRLVRGASLLHELTDGGTVETAIRQAAAEGELPTYPPLARYYPVKELEGRPSPDFKAPRLSDRVESRFSNLLDDSKLNVLVFWSVDCPHCREELPEINELARQNREDLNIVTLARAADASTWDRTRQFAESNGFEFPTLVDEDAAIIELYGVTTTPTVLIVGPDGVVDSAIVSHSDHGSLGQTLERKKRELLPSSS